MIYSIKSMDCIECLISTHDTTDFFDLMCYLAYIVFVIFFSPCFFVSKYYENTFKDWDGTACAITASPSLLAPASMQEDASNMAASGTSTPAACRASIKRPTSLAISAPFEAASIVRTMNA